IANGPNNIIAVVGGAANLAVGDVTSGGLRIYQNLCVDSDQCSAGSFIDVTDAAIATPDCGSNCTAPLALPILATDVAFADLNSDGVIDMIVTKDFGSANEVYMGAR